MKTYLNLKEVSERCRANGWGYSSDGEPLPFTEYQFKKIAELLGNVESNPSYRSLFEELARWIHETLRPRRSLELGCGPGYLVYCMNRLGIDALGVDGNSFFWRDFQLVHYDIRDRYILDPLFELPTQSADLFASIEVFEHIPDDGLHHVMRRVRDDLRSRFIVFSSTPYKSEEPDWDLQWGHINLKQPDDWAKFFSDYGYKLLSDKPPVTEWAQLYERVK